MGNDLFLKLRMELLELTEEQNSTGVEVTSAINDYPAKAPTKLLDCDQEGNILIYNYQIDGTEYWYDNGNKNSPERQYHVTRYRIPKKKWDFEKGIEVEQKYNRKKMLPYFTPTVIQKYLAKEQVETLFFIEGELKALAGWINGLDIIGLGSNQGFYDPDTKGKLHADIINAIIALNPTNVVLINDADALTIHYEPKKDLHKRVNNFLSAVMNFREAIDPLLTDQSLALQRVYYSHIRTEYHNTAKGLDDLLGLFQNRKEQIIADLLAFNRAKEFFSCENLTSANRKGLEKYFGVSSPDAFYALYREFIGDREFIYKNVKYQYNETERELVRIRHQDADIFLRVGDKYAKIIEKPLYGGTTATDITKFAKTEIKEDYGEYFVKQVLKIDGMTIEPSNLNDYSRLIELNKEGRTYRFYNMYEPLAHPIEQGSIEHTLKYLKHLFGGEAHIELQADGTYREHHVLGDPFSIAIDWLTILYRFPKQFLPVMLLVSKEQGTGKTTIIDWNHAIYQTNLISMKMEQFLGNFNKHWAFKLVRCIDEGSLDLEKATAKNTFKNLTTAKNILVELKGIDIQEIPNYGKMIICGNDEDKILRLEDEDTRFFPVKVPPIPPERKDPEFLEKLKSEIPAWLHFIAKRQIFHPKEDRLWFKTEYLKTEQFKRIVASTRPQHEVEIEEFIKNILLTYCLFEIRLSSDYLLEKINDRSKYKVSLVQLYDYLKKKGWRTSRNGVVSTDGNTTFKVPVGFDDTPDTDGKARIIWHKITGRYFQFRAEMFCDQEELDTIGKGLQAEMSQYDPSKVSYMVNGTAQEGVYQFLKTLRTGDIALPELHKQFEQSTQKHITLEVFTQNLSEFIKYSDEVLYCDKDNVSWNPMEIKGNRLVINDSPF